MGKKKLILILSIISIVLGITACILFFVFLGKQKEDVKTPDIENTTLIPTGHFEVDIFRQSFVDSVEDNIVVSPFSIKVAMAMATEGAGGYTLKELQDVLLIGDISKEEFKYIIENIYEQEDVVFNIANSVWSKKGYVFKQTYLDTLTNYYQAEARELDFSDVEGSKEIINGWVERKTEGKIDSIVDSIEPSHIMFLINAIYFNADWTEQFNEDLTEEKQFTLLDNTKVNTNMMYREGTMKYLENEQFQAVELPYGEGKRFVMRVYLPKQEIQLKKFVSELKAIDLDEWVDELEFKEVHLSLPKFKVEWEGSLKGILGKLGIKDAFVPGVADFGEMVPTSSKDIYIGDVKHKTYIDVSERGTEAAAVTSVEMEVTSAPSQPEEIYQMDVNRPFFFTIEDTQTNIYMFMGAISDPRPTM